MMESHGKVALQIKKSTKSSRLGLASLRIGLDSRNSEVGWVRVLELWVLQPPGLLAPITDKKTWKLLSQCDLALSCPSSTERPSSHSPCGSKLLLMNSSSALFVVPSSGHFVFRLASGLFQRWDALSLPLTIGLFELAASSQAGHCRPTGGSPPRQQTGVQVGVHVPWYLSMRFMQREDRSKKK